MLYASVRESAALFQKKMKQKQSYQDIQIFRWKFVVLGLGVVLVILIGICSQLIKTLTSRKDIPINTTFLATLLPNSELARQQLINLENMILSLQQSNEIKFDKATKLFEGNKTSGQSIYKIISGKSNLLVLLKLGYEDQEGKYLDRKVGIYLHSMLPKIDIEGDANVNVADKKDQMNSAIFNMNYRKTTILDKSQSCYISQYSSSTKQLNLIQLLHLDRNGIKSQIKYQIKNYECFQTNGNNNKKEVATYVSDLIGQPIKEDQSNVLSLIWMEIFYLQYQDVDFGKIYSRIV